MGSRALLAFSLLMISGSAFAVNLETMLMPGKVIEGHAKYEEECDKCHEAFSKTSQRRLCLDCHKEVAKDIHREQGFHGRDASIRVDECKRCHSDHLGRDADIVQFNTGLFDHKQTDFELKGAHSKLACGACHKSDQPYRKTLGKCFDCHEKRDVHKEKFGKECDKCHQQDSWRKTKFDHDKTKFKLTGKHKEVSCGLCHPKQQYKDVPQQCVACHRLNDIHDGGYGEKCQDCHSTKGWDGYNFDHDKKTKFALKGKHKDAKCASCHTKHDYKKKLKMECIACHKKQDTHKGGLGEKCESCHGAKSWREHKFDHKNFRKTACHDCHKVDDIHKGRYGTKCDSCHKVTSWRKQKFNHDKETKFPLRGKHKDAACSTCHQGDAKQEKDKRECVKCHGLDNVHQDKHYENCQQCHNEKGWREDVRFDHDLSDFPLIGLHATTACEQCHINLQFKGTKLACYSCHELDDEHKGRLGKRCEQCHNPNSWKFWQFDHDKTDFKLKGAHEKLMCEACHKTVVKDEIDLPKDCAGCHRGDDIHNGSFGRQCDRCHSDRSFRDISLKP